MRAADCTRSRLTHDPAHRSRVMRCGTALLVVTIMFTFVACSESTRSSTASTSTATPFATSTATPSTAATTLPPAQPRLASDPAQLAGDLVFDEQALRDPFSSEAVLVGAARRQQAAYRPSPGIPSGTRSRACKSRRRSSTPTTTTTPSSGTTTQTGTSGRSTITPPCSQPIPLCSPATTDGLSTTTRLLVTCSCPSVTSQPHRFPSPTIWRPTRSENLPGRCRAVDTVAELVGAALNDRRRRGVVNDVGQRHDDHRRVPGRRTPTMARHPTARSWARRR
jgi:hypothetical protein